MNKKRIILISILSIIIISFFGFKKYAELVKDKDCITTKTSSKIFDFNSFDLKVDSSLLLADFKVVNQNSGKTIFEKGKSHKGIKNEYGHCVFELFWKEEKVYEFGHFKFNNWYTNEYELRIRLVNNELKPSLQIYGPSGGRNKNAYFRKVAE